MKEHKQISVEEYRQLRKEVGNWQVAIILFGLFIFILGALLIAQGSRYFILMYSSIAVMFGMASIGLFPPLMHPWRCLLVNSLNYQLKKVEFVLYQVYLSHVQSQIGYKKSTKRSGNRPLKSTSACCDNA